jgi:hypothetical protein
VAHLEGDVEPAQADAPQHLVHVGLLGALGFQELAPGRRVEKEIAHLHRRSPRMRGGADLDIPRAVHLQARSVSGVRRCRGDREPGHGRHAGKRLPAEPEAADSNQVVRPRDLAGSVSCDGQRQVGRVDALPVVADEDALYAAELGLQPNRPRTRIKAVLDELLHQRSRALDHLARGDLVGDEGF